MKVKDVMNSKATVLITGGVGFIGFHLSRYLLNSSCHIVGYDNMNDYYDVELKKARLNILQIDSNYKFVKGDLADADAVGELFKIYRPDYVINLGAQAGVRYSIENPRAYLDSNIIGFFNILEACRNYNVKHLIFASSSSVYGNNIHIPFSIKERTDQPESFYAATKKSDEMMAYAYSRLYSIRTTGLRFFTVYGPLGRPDMAYFKFADRMRNGLPIQIYNNGDMYRDFTYIDDVVEGIVRVLFGEVVKKNGEEVPYKLYNIGNSKPEKISYFIQCLEKEMGITAIKEYLPMQPGDVYRTFADVEELKKDFNYRPNTLLSEGLKRFASWYKDYYHM